MDLTRYIADVADFPQPGILFRDVSPLLADAVAFGAAVHALGAAAADLEADLVAGIEARGFIFGAALATRLGRGFLPVRKRGKLPGEVHRASYALEYGEDVLELRAGIVPAGARVLLVDDVLATGGTLDAARRLAQAAGLVAVGAAVLVELEALGGRARLGTSLPVRSVLRY
ncbi:MAG: adenine phosphoribosyltransferase [Xanthomonadaceae bacterium]|nr:adenine phosphoribosyltransferase [Xanthomonadaceae bacterium]